MTSEQEAEHLLDWLNWYVQNDSTVTIEEEDGGVILSMFCGQLPEGQFVGASPLDALRQAVEAFQIPEEGK